MNCKEMFSNRTVGFYLGLAAGILTIVSLATYFMYAAAAGSYNALVIVPLIVVLVSQLSTLVIDNDWLVAVTPIVSMIALCAFVMECMYTYVGHFMNLNMFGDQSLFGQVWTATLALAATQLVLLVAAFMRKRK
jgi:hypothetical protein